MMQRASSADRTFISKNRMPAGSLMTNLYPRKGEDILLVRYSWTMVTLIYPSHSLISSHWDPSSIRQDALLKYSSLNQSKSLRINLYTTVFYLWHYSPSPHYPRLLHQLLVDSVQSHYSSMNVMISVFLFACAPLLNTAASNWPDCESIICKYFEDICYTFNLLGEGSYILKLALKEPTHIHIDDICAVCCNFAKLTWLSTQQTPLVCKNLLSLENWKVG